MRAAPCRAPREAAGRRRGAAEHEQRGRSRRDPRPPRAPPAALVSPDPAQQHQHKQSSNRSTGNSIEPSGSSLCGLLSSCCRSGRPCVPDLRGPGLRVGTQQPRPLQQQQRRRRRSRSRSPASTGSGSPDGRDDAGRLQVDDRPRSCPVRRSRESQARTDHAAPPLAWRSYCGLSSS